MRQSESLLVILVIFSLQQLVNSTGNTGLWDALQAELKSTISKISPDIYYEMHLSVPDTIRYRGYDCEQHQVTTEDGFILTLHRVLPRAALLNHSRPAVFLQHGLLDSSFAWVANTRQQSLAFVLVDQGFDVWLGNSRGNKYSRQHVILNPDNDSAFWLWDYDQMAAFDLQASVHYVTRATGQQSIAWVGHSQGCLIALAGLLDEHVARKIKVFVALAPAARVDHINSTFLRALAPHVSTVQNLLESFGSIGEFMPNDNFYTWLGGTVCSNLPIICEELIDIMAGFNSADINATRLPVFFTHYPAGTSLQNMVHFAQAIEQARFQHFDYGILGNLQRYHSLRPPQYDLKQMKVPTAVFWGSKDKLADETDVKWLLGELPNVILQTEIKDFAHTDFTRGINAHKLVYPTVIELLR